MKLKVNKIDQYIDKQQFEKELISYLRDSGQQRMPRYLVECISKIVTAVICDRVITDTDHTNNLNGFISETIEYIINTFQTGDWPEEWRAQYVNGAVAWIISLTKNYIYHYGPRYYIVLKKRKRYGKR